MARHLNVFFLDHLCGVLTQEDTGQITFQYDRNWLDHPHGVPLSHSLPLRPEPFSQKECSAYFGGVLPEQDVRDLIAKNLGISNRNDFALLEMIGGECAGVVSFLKQGEVPRATANDYRPMTEKELADTIRMLSRRPLLAGQDQIRLSLAGAQTKLAVFVENGKVSVPLNGSPSSHILKPGSKSFPGLIYNEHFCMKLAASAGLDVAQTQIESTAGVDYLLIKRYDRIQSGQGTERLHQEDFCQALGVNSEMKYQSEGGPSLKSCFDLVRSTSSNQIKDIQALLNASIFNFVVGNHDAHGKNFSFLYGPFEQPRTVRFAPLYDLVSTVCYPELSKKMAMKIGREYDSSKISLNHWKKLAEESGLSPSQTTRHVTQFVQTIREKLELQEVNPNTAGIAETLKKRIQFVQAKFSNNSANAN